MNDDNATRRAVVDALLNSAWTNLPGVDVKYGNEISPMITGLRAIQSQAAEPVPYVALQQQLPQYAYRGANGVIGNEENSPQSIDEPLAAQQASEAAAMRQRRAVLPPRGRQEHPMGVAGRLGEIGGGIVDFMLPTGPLDVGLMVAGGPFGKVGTKVVAATLGAMLESDEAQSGPISKMVRAARRRGGDASHVRADRTPEIYDPPPHQQRAFTDDYPNSPRTDAAGNLTHDMDGRPLHAQFVSGRRTQGGPDVGMQRGDYDRVAMALMGKKPAYQRARDMEPDEWGYSEFDQSGRMTDMALRRSMRLPDRLRVYAHELAHGIDEFVRQIPVETFMRELKPLYNTLNNPRRTPDGRSLPGRTITPEYFRYPRDDVPREYAAEAIRMYLTHPNYIKSVAPETAAMIRKWVNEHPDLSRIIQFNSLLAVPAAGLARRSEQAENEF